MPIFEINRFRKARLSAKMTQAQAAEKIGVDPITIIQWEKGSNITAAEKKIKAFSDSHKEKGATCFCVTSVEAENILREFYGLPRPDEIKPAAPPPPAKKLVDLSDFL